MVPLNRFWTLTLLFPLFSRPTFRSAFVVYIIGASVKQSDAVDRIDARVVFVGMAQNLSVRLAVVGTSTPKGVGGVVPVQILPAP